MGMDWQPSDGVGDGIGPCPPLEQESAYWLEVSTEDQGAAHPIHLQSYLDEFVFRFNRRRSSSFPVIG
jgi:hypothetical protein